MIKRPEPQTQTQTRKKPRRLRGASRGAALALALLLTVGAFYVGVMPETLPVAAKKRELPVYSVDRDDGAVAISFDASWGGDKTEKLLDIAREAKKAGIEMLMDTINDILGQRSEAELSGRIRELLAEEPEVQGAYDLFLYNYGPDKDYASVHLELPDTMTAADVD